MPAGRRRPPARPPQRRSPLAYRWQRLAPSPGCRSRLTWQRGQNRQPPKGRPRHARAARCSPSPAPRAVVHGRSPAGGRARRAVHARHSSPTPRPPQDEAPAEAPPRGPPRGRRFPLTRRRRTRRAAHRPASADLASLGLVLGPSAQRRRPPLCRPPPLPPRAMLAQSVPLPPRPLPTPPVPRRAPRRRAISRGRGHGHGPRLGPT